MTSQRSPAARSRLVGVLLTAALSVAACSGGSGDGEEAGGASSSGDRGADAGGFPVSIEHRYGTTTIEQVPERVVTVGLLEQDTLLALGIAPVGTTEWFGEHPGAIFQWAEDELEALGAEPPEVVADSESVNVEAVAAQRPDLILAVHSDLTEENYERLSELAPTVAPPEGYVDYGVPWQELAGMVGQAVGKSDEADALVADVEGRFDEIRSEHPEFQGATAIMAMAYEGIYVYGPEDPRSRLLAALGFELPAGLREVTGDEFGGNLSEERADMLDGDVIIWLDADDAEGPLGGPLYDTLPVHTEGREVFLDSFDDPLGAATSFITPLSLPYLLDGLVPQLAAAIDGDPATEVASGSAG
jgi:iron complex transport system substrate-binding protein